MLWATIRSKNYRRPPLLHHQNGHSLRERERDKEKVIESECIKRRSGWKKKEFDVQSLSFSLKRGLEKHMLIQS